MKRQVIKKKPQITDIKVSCIQIKNPIIKHFFFNYDLEKDEENSRLFDFKILDKFVCFFLSLKYHQKYPSYILDKITTFDEKMRTIKNENHFKFLFCLFDESDEDADNKVKALKGDNLLNSTTFVL